MLPSWSHSRLTDFEKCKYRVFLMHVEKVPEPQRPLPAGKTEHANDRGTRVHEGCEHFVRGDIDVMPPEARKHFGAEMERMRALYQEGLVSLEGEWGMSRNWEPWDWNGQWVESPVLAAATLGDEQIQAVKELPKRAKPGEVYQVGKKFFTWVPAWLRLKLDALVFLSKHRAVAIDYKTGKRFGNELKHGEQLQLYQLVTFLRYPELEEVTTELWYLDVDDLASKTFTRDQGLRFQRSWDKRGNNVTTCQDFRPNPNIHSCKWCEYGPWGSGHCQVGKR